MLWWCFKENKSMQSSWKFYFLWFFYSSCPGFKSVIKKVRTQGYLCRQAFRDELPGAQKGESKESTGVMAKQVSKIIFKVRCYISSKGLKLKSHTSEVCGRSEGQGMVWPLTNALHWKFGSANCWLLMPGQSRGQCTAEDTSVQNESNSSTEMNGVSLISSRIFPAFASVCWLLSVAAQPTSSCFPFLHNLPLEEHSSNLLVPYLPPLKTFITSRAPKLLGLSCTYNGFHNLILF